MTERKPDITINLCRPDLRLVFGKYDVEITAPLEGWILGPMEAPPPGCATAKLDTGELFAFRPVKGDRNDERAQRLQ